MECTIFLRAECSLKETTLNTKGWGIWEQRILPTLKGQRPQVKGLQANKRRDGFTSVTLGLFLKLAFRCLLPFYVGLPCQDRSFGLFPTSIATSLSGKACGDPAE